LLNIYHKHIHNDPKQKFTRYLNFILNPYSDKCIDRGNPNALWNCDAGNGNQVMSLLK